MADIIPQFADTSGIFHRAGLLNYPFVNAWEVIGYIHGDWRQREQFATCAGNISGLPADGSQILQNNVLCTITEATFAATARGRRSQRSVNKGRSGSKPITGRAYRDLTDFRDKFYIPTLVEVARERPLSEFKRRAGRGFPILDQKLDGACTGFALATVAHYLLRTRTKNKDRSNVSAHMMYELAKRYDEWPGEDYSGSSARGTMKAWHKHGICRETLWKAGAGQSRFDKSVARDSIERPLGAYFRVDHKDLVAMHSAISETGILFATLETHAGWGAVNKDGRIKDVNGKYPAGGGHAVAIVAYDSKGFWFQNSWGRNWGKGGYGHITYNDWLTNGWDVWVARLGARVDLAASAAMTTEYSSTRAAQTSGSVQLLRPHIISVGNNGLLSQRGTFANTATDVQKLFTGPCLDTLAKWKDKRRIVIYAHGGLVNEDTAVQRVADYREILLRNHIYPISFIWHSGFWETLGSMLSDSLSKRRAEGALGERHHSLLDRLDSLLEAFSASAGRRVWEEMKENALGATVDPDGAVRHVIAGLLQVLKKYPGTEIHFVGHSAGSILLAPFVQYWCSPATPIAQGPLKNAGLKGLARQAGSLVHWAPAITHTLFRETCLPVIGKKLKAYHLYMLDDATEQDDHCANIYHKSLLYLVSNAFERVRATPAGVGGTPLLGMEKWLDHQGLRRDLTNVGTSIVLSPQAGANSPTTTKHHGDFDDNEACTGSTLRILLSGKDPVTAPKAFGPSGASLREQVSIINQRNLGRDVERFT